MKLDLEQSLITLIADAFKNQFNIEINHSQINIEPTNDDFEGDYTVILFPYIKLIGKNPLEIGEQIGQYLKSNSYIISTYNIVKGFLNLSISNQFWLSFLHSNASNTEFGALNYANGKKVMVEYSSPNTNKPLHLGHVRNNLLGYAVSQILKLSGHDLVKANLINDRGIHICKSMLAYQRFGNGETPESSGLKGDHLVGKYYVMFDQFQSEEIKTLLENGMDIDMAKKNNSWIKDAQQLLVKWEQNDTETKELWHKMNQWVYDGFNITYSRLGVDFDVRYYESNTYLLGKDMIQKGLDQEVFYQKEDQSVWIDLTNEGLDHKLVLRGDGTSVYITQDIGTAQLKYDDFKISKSIYVVGNEQDYHFKVLKAILQKLGEPYADEIYHLSYGMVDLPHGKMKSREGTVVDADELMQDMFTEAKSICIAQGKTEHLNAEEIDNLAETIGMAALKYYLLKVDPSKRMLFNPAESIDFIGNTGPFIQYTSTRIKSILRNYNKAIPSEMLNVELQNQEKSLLFTLYQFPQKVYLASETLSPSIIANYMFDLAKNFNRMYHDLSILGEKDENQKIARLQICNLTLTVLNRCAWCLGIQLPEKM